MIFVVETGVPQGSRLGPMAYETIHRNLLLRMVKYYGIKRTVLK